MPQVLSPRPQILQFGQSAYSAIPDEELAVSFGIFGLRSRSVASRYRFSVDAIYAWVRTGLIPAGCILRMGNSIRIDSDQFDRLLRAGKLYRPRCRNAEQRARHSREAASALGASEDQHTTKQERGRYEHRFTSDSGSVSADHPYSPTLNEPAG
jgi:hypothetical protein